jgi:hypothetical protein
LVAKAWRLVREVFFQCEHNSDLSMKLLSAVLRAGFALMISTVIRQQEFTAITDYQVDLLCVAIRIAGKQSAFFARRGTPHKSQVRRLTQR